MTEIMRKKINWEGIRFYTASVALSIGFVFTVRWVITTHTETKIEQREIACPSLLSIGRSARDTLIIMKVEPLCNDYVLNNLK